LGGLAAAAPKVPHLSDFLSGNWGQKKHEYKQNSPEKNPDQRTGEARSLKRGKR